MQGVHFQIVFSAFLNAMRSCIAFPSSSIAHLFHAVNAINFERASYEADEDVDEFVQLRLVASYPFPVDTKVSVLFADISAFGKHSMCCM